MLMEKDSLQWQDAGRCTADGSNAIYSEQKKCSETWNKAVGSQMRLETGPRGLLFDGYEEDIVKEKKVILKKKMLPLVLPLIRPPYEINV